MTYYLAEQHLPRVGDTSYKPGDLIPADTTGLNNGIAIGLISVHAGDPPDELIPEPTPAAKKAARQEKVDLEEVEGSGKSERVTKADVEEAAEETPEKPKSRSRSKKSE